MFDLDPHEEEIIKILAVRNPISEKELSLDLAGNLLSGAGDDIVDKVNMILTESNLYLQYKRQGLIGNKEEITNITRLPLGNIQEFSVESNEIKEVITIKSGDKTYNFIRDNYAQDNLASAMAKLIKSK